MKFTCTQENLAHGLQLVSRIAGKNIALPILHNVLLKAEGGQLQLQTTNLELGMTVVVRAKIETEGQYTVQARLFSDLIAALEDNKVEIEMTPQGLQINADGSSTLLKGVSAEEFPVVPTHQATHTVTVPAQTLRQGLTSVQFAAANDESRPEISGLYMRLDGKQLWMAATDSYRLAERILTTLEGVTAPTSAIIPSRTSQELARALPDDETVVRIELSENQVRCSWDDVSLVSRLVEGRYPEYNQIIPQQWATVAVVGREKLIAKIRAASLFCKPGIQDITLEIDPASKAIKFSAANTQVGEHHDQLEAMITGQNQEVVLNYRYVLDGLATLPNTDVEFRVNNNETPTLFVPTSAEGHVYLVMPIRQ